MVPRMISIYLLNAYANLAVNSEQIRLVNELKTLQNLRPCLGPDSILRVQGRLKTPISPRIPSTVYFCPVDMR